MLRVGDIDSKRMLIRVELGKGRHIGLKGADLGRRGPGLGRRSTDKRNDGGSADPPTKSDVPAGDPDRVRHSRLPQSPHLARVP